MTLVCGIDPGTLRSGIVVFDLEERRVTFAGELDNGVLLLVLRQEELARELDAGTWSALYIETIECQGLAVGRETFQTAIWIGKFSEAWERSSGRTVQLVSRADEKITLCGRSCYTNPETGKRKGVGDSEIRRAILERFPGTGGGACPQVGTKGRPGPLYGVKGHAWSALAVLLTGLETSEGHAT